MSATGKTTNYALPLYNENDITTWSDFNLAMTDIDAAVKGVSDTASTGSSTATQALSAANAASTLATEANNNATTATSKANDAVAIANNANTQAGDAITDAHAALAASTKNTQSITTINNTLTYTRQRNLLFETLTPGTDYTGINETYTSRRQAAIKMSFNIRTSGINKLPVFTRGVNQYVGVGKFTGNPLELTTVEESPTNIPYYFMGAINVLNMGTTPVVPSYMNVYIFVQGNVSYIVTDQDAIGDNRSVYGTVVFHSTGTIVPLTDNMLVSLASL